VITVTRYDGVVWGILLGVLLIALKVYGVIN
jgi:hypothetical protein